MPKVIFDLPNMDDPAWAEAIEHEIEMELSSGNEPHPDRPLPFDCVIYDSSPVRVKNKLTGDSCMLEPDAVAVYDTTIGALYTGNYERMNQGLDWFRKYFPKEYMILLD